MKLIDILVEELPKRDGWPEKASHAVYAKRFSRVCFTVGGAPAITGDDVSIFEDDGAGHGVFWLPGALLDCEEPIDYATAIITREQYEAALAAKNDGLIDWGGGECPLPEGALVDVRYRNSEKFPDAFGTIALAVGGYGATGRHWNHDGYPNDIIAYRLHQPKEVEQTEAEQESDLNKCIGQDAAPVWNGEGLPPVGCVCERSWAGDKWLQCEIIFTGNEIVLVKLATREAAYRLSDVRFRPIRSEADRKRDEAAQALCNAGGGNGKVDEKAGYGSCWFDVYDAIAAGKIPGVKLDD